MNENNKKTGNGNPSNAENNIFRTITKSTEQLTASAARYDERAENGQKIVFIIAEQKKALGNAANADKAGYLPGIFWSGYVTTQDGHRHDFSRLDSNGISRKFADICTWKRATRATLLDGSATRTDEQRKADAQKAIEEARIKFAPNSVTAMLWGLATGATIRINSVDTPLMDELKRVVLSTMEHADTTAAEKAQSKESKTAQRERELAEAKQAAEAAGNANAKAIQMLLATGLYKDEAEVKAKLGL